MQRHHKEPATVVLEKLVERGLKLKDGVPGADSAYFYEANEE